MRATCAIRPQLHYRRDRFCSGLEAAGYRLHDQIADPKPGDVYVCWNKYGYWASECDRFERAGARAIVAENGYLGKNWNGSTWFAMALHDHAGAGIWMCGSEDRWGSFGVDLADWKPDGCDLVILQQRGIGSDETKSPLGWAEETQKKYGGRIRRHPGKDKNAKPLEEDLSTASVVLTWASGAALKALALGVPVYYEMRSWIGRYAALPISEFGRAPPKRDDGARLAMFRRLAWAQWRIEEIEDGRAFRQLLG